MPANPFFFLATITGRFGQTTTAEVCAGSPQQWVFSLWSVPCVLACFKQSRLGCTRAIDTRRTCTWGIGVEPPRPWTNMRMVRCWVCYQGTQPLGTTSLIVWQGAQTIYAQTHLMATAALLSGIYLTACAQVPAISSSVCVNTFPGLCKVGLFNRWTSS